MSYIRGESREQMHLLPEAIDDYVGAANPVRFLDVFVEHLDLTALGFAHATPAETGRPPYDPGDLLRLYLYGYLNRIRSSRRLETEAGRNLELMWLLRKLRPDFKTIAAGATRPFASASSEFVSWSDQQPGGHQHVPFV